MAKNPWVLPDGFDSSVNKGIKELIASLKKSGKAIPQAAYDQLAMGDINAFYRLIDFEGLGDDLDGIKEIIRQQAESSAKQVFTMGGVQAQLAFDLVDARAVEYAAQSSAKLVREITDEMRQNIQQNIARATAGEITFPELVTELQMKLPLTARGSAAVDRFQQSNYERYLRQGLSETKAKRKAFDKATRYRNKLVEDRAKVIARTEVADAAMQGRYLGWESGVQSGIIDNQSVKEWIAEPDACPICLPLDGMIIGWTGDFPIGASGTTGTTDRMPPAHPNCRCSVALLPPDFAESVYTEQSGGEMPPEEQQRSRIPKGIQIDGGADLTVGDNPDRQAIRDVYNDEVRKEVERKLGREMRMEDRYSSQYQAALALVPETPQFRQRVANLPQLQKFATLTTAGKQNALDVYASAMLPSKFDDFGKVVYEAISDDSIRRSKRLTGVGFWSKDSIADQLKKLGDIDAKEVIDRANNQLQKFISKATPSVMIDAQGLQGVLETGRFKSAFEELRARSTGYLANRKMYEAKAFGYTEFTPAVERPIYGALVGKTKASYNNVSVYGDLQVVLKPEVMARTSLTIGDSLNQYSAPFAAMGGKPPANYASNSLNKAAGWDRLSKKTNYFDSTEFTDYVEMQIHGGLEPSDIEKVVMPRWAKSNTIIEALDAAGIPWEVKD